MDVSTCKTSSDNRWGRGGCWGQQEVRNGVCGELQMLETHDGWPRVMKGWRTLHKKAKSGFLLQSCAHLQPSTSLPVQVCVRVCVVMQNSRKPLHTLTHLPLCIDQHRSPPSRTLDLDFSCSSPSGGGSHVAGGYTTVVHTDHGCDDDARLRGDPCNVWQNASSTPTNVHCDPINTTMTIFVQCLLGFAFLPVAVKI